MARHPGDPAAACPGHSRGAGRGAGACRLVFCSKTYQRNCQAPSQCSEGREWAERSEACLLRRRGAQRGREQRAPEGFPGCEALAGSGRPSRWRHGDVRAGPEPARPRGANGGEPVRTQGMGRARRASAQPRRSVGAAPRFRALPVSAVVGAGGAGAGFRTLPVSAVVGAAYGPLGGHAREANRRGRRQRVPPADVRREALRGDLRVRPREDLPGDFDAHLLLGRGRGVRPRVVCARQEGDEGYGSHGGSRASGTGTVCQRSREADRAHGPRVHERGPNGRAPAAASGGQGSSGSRSGGKFELGQVSA